MIRSRFVRFVVYCSALVFSLFFSRHVPAEEGSWPKVAFLPWPKVLPRSILDPVPVEYSASSLGSVQPRKFIRNPLKDRPRCNRQSKDGSWVPDWCDWQLTQIPRVE